MTFHAAEGFRSVVANAWSFEAARREALCLVGPIDRRDSVPLGSASGRVLAETIVAPRHLPAFDQAAMDGYAVRFADITDAPLHVDGTTLAGDHPTRLTPGTVRRIMTGAGLPAGADTVVPHEETVIAGTGLVTVNAAHPGGNIRRAGEDIACGSVLLEKGRRLAWPDIAALAALGIGAVEVIATARVVLLTTGAELCDAGETLPMAAVYDSNGPMLAALLAGSGIEVTRMAVGDDHDALTEQLAAAGRGADLVVTSAGMSSGDRDLVRAAVAAAGGTIVVPSVAMKPGKPLALGTIGGAAFVGLPGNPQAAAVAALAFIRPMIAALIGRPAASPVMVRSGFAGPSRRDRTELVPVALDAGSGQLVARPAGQTGSHRLMPLLAADAVAIVPPADVPLKSGDPLEVLPFRDLDFQGVLP